MACQIPNLQPDLFPTLLLYLPHLTKGIHILALTITILLPHMLSYRTQAAEEIPKLVIVLNLTGVKIIWFTWLQLQTLTQLH